VETSAYGHAELHTDGSACAAGLLARAQPDGGIGVDDQVLVSELVECLAIVVRHAVMNTRCSGEAVVLGEIIEPGRLTGAIDRSMVLTYDRSHFTDQWPGSRMTFRVPPSEHSVDLDACASDPVALLATARLFLNDLFQGFGVAEVPQINPEGALRRRYLLDREGQVFAWAEIHGVPLTDEGLKP
jgi:hypothetical protein